MKTPEQFFSELPKAKGWLSAKLIDIERISAIQSDARADLERELKEAVELLEDAPVEWMPTEWWERRKAFLARHRKENK